MRLEERMECFFATLEYLGGDEEDFLRVLKILLAAISQKDGLILAGRVCNARLFKRSRLRLYERLDKLNDIDGRILLDLINA